MKITALKICGLENPIGYALQSVTVSWRVEESASLRQKESTLRIAADPRMKDVIYEKVGVLPCYGVTAELTLAPRTTYYVHVSVRGEAGDEAEAVGFFETGKMGEAWTAKWIGVAEDCEYHPELFTAFRTQGSIEKARLYITGVGLYEATINGEKVGDDLLTPFFNDYRHALQVQTYDVTRMLGDENTLSVLLGNGWYKGRLGFDGEQGMFGKQFALLAELRIRYADGSEQVVITDDDWHARASDVTFSDIYDGEGRDLVKFAKERPSIPLAPLDMSSLKLVDRYSLPLHEMETLPVKEIIITSAGETVLDFGQNFSGFVCFHAKHFPSGTEILLEHGEVLQQGNFYHDNYRSAKTLISYISDGREEWVRPHFTYMGFRYVKVTGWPGALDPSDFSGIAIYSAMERTGWLTTGHSGVNQLISNALWGLKSNFVDMPTDCPQRDERLGWTGDAQVFASTAGFFMDTKAFYRKFLWDLRNEQIERHGAVSHFLPNLRGEEGGASVWADAATIIPDNVYETFGDQGLLKENYPLMKDWVDWITNHDKRRGQRYSFDFAFTFGDWLAMDGVTEQSLKGGTEDAYIATVYYYVSAMKTARAAKALGYDEDKRAYAELAAHIRETLLSEYFTPSGRLAIDTQTGYVLALYYGIWRDKAALEKGLRTRLKRDGNRIRCGFTGAPLICLALAENGMEDLAIHLFLQKKFPSWLHCVSLGATTIWERWNSVLDDGSISGTGMNSLNHYAYGSIIRYAVCNLAGLAPLKTGYRKVRIAPLPEPRLGKMDLRYVSASGTYHVAWDIVADGSLTLRCEIPFDCEAEVVLPETGEKVCLTAGVYDFHIREKKDWRALYHMDTMLDEVVEDERAMALLHEALPAAWGMASGGDIEALSMTFRDLMASPWFGFTPEEVERAVAKLSALRAE